MRVSESKKVRGVTQIEDCKIQKVSLVAFRHLWCHHVVALYEVLAASQFLPWIYKGDPTVFSCPHR